MNSITLNPETGIMSIKDMKVGTIFLISDCIYMRLDRRDPMNDKIACAGLRSGGLFWILESTEGKVFKGNLCLTTGV